MPETGSQILSYQGNAAAGLGSNAGIPAIDPRANLDVINNSARDILLLNHDNNIKLYDQKIKDRDETLKLLASGQVASGEISPQDRPIYDRAKQATKDAFYDMINKGGLNNPDAVRDYQDKVTDLYNTATHAQSRQIELSKLRQEQSNQSLPEDVAMYNTHINKEVSKPFWQPINPLQKAFDYNIKQQEAKYSGQPITSGNIGQLGEDGLPNATTQWNTTTDKNGVITNKQTTKTVPLKNALISKTSGKGTATSEVVVNKDGSISPISKTPEKRWDFDTIQQNVYNQAATDRTDAYTQQKYLSDVGNLPDYKLLPYLKAANNQLERYSTENGIQPDGTTNPDGSPHYPNQIKYYQDPISKQVHIVENPQTFMAKHVLSSIDGDYVEKGQDVFNDKIGKYNIDLKKANTDAIYKNVLGHSAATKANAFAANLRQQMKFREKGAEQDNLLDNFFIKNYTEQPLIKGEGNNRISLTPIKADNSLPLFTLDGNKPKQLIPIGAKAIYDKYVYDSNGNKTDQPDPKAKITHYEGGRFDPVLLLNDKQLTTDQISDNYLRFKKTPYGKTWGGGLEDYIKEAVKHNKYKVKIKGANGATDNDLSRAALRIISNQSTKKGQQAVFDNNDNVPLDESGVSESGESDNNTNPNQ